MSDYMQEAERLIGDLISAVDFEDQSAETKARSALLAHIERGRVPEGAKPAAWAVSGQDLSDYSVWRNEPDEEQLEILNSQCKDGPIIVRTLFFAAPAAPDHSGAQKHLDPDVSRILSDNMHKMYECATAPAEVPMPEPYCHLTTGSVEWMRNSPETRTVSATASGKPNENTRPVFLVEQMQLYGDAREAAGYARGMAAKGGA